MTCPNKKKQVIFSNLDDLIAHCTLGGTLASLDRMVYKGTDCGAWIDTIPSQHHFESAGITEDLQEVEGVMVGSIVEGCDDSVEPITLTFPFTEDAFWGALGQIEEGAKEIWNRTHGCETCLKHWGGGCDEWGNEYETGNCPVWDECPDCEGYGEVI